MSTGRDKPTLRVRLEGEKARLGQIPAADVAQLLISVERVIARAASVVVGRPSRKPGPKERVVNQATHVILRALEEGSVVPVLELPVISLSEEQAVIDVDAAHLGEVAAAQVFDVIANEVDGHPYVVEALADLGRQLGIGTRYDWVDFELGHSRIQRRPAKLDADTASRLRDRVRMDRLAAREGMLVGTLVEADFESYTARLRSPEGQPIAVSFDPSMADEIQTALREPATVEGWITYDPSDQTAKSINLRKVSRGDQLILGIDPRTYRQTLTFRQLQEQQGVTGRFDADELFDSDSGEEELEKYDGLLQRLSD